MLPSTAKKAILSLDYDWREQKVFWASLDTESIRWSSLDQNTKGTLIRGAWSGAHTAAPTTKLNTGQT